jgi:hypothetical protein
VQKLIECLGGGVGFSACISELADCLLNQGLVVILA